MASTDAGTPAAGNDHPPPEPKPRRGLRDSALGKLLLLGLVLAAAFVSTRACGAADRNVSSDEAIEIAKENASFEPCPQVPCAQSRYIQRGIPPRAYWGVVLSEKLRADGQPTRYESFLVDAITGDVSRP
jgi:predicted small secreted protein